MESFRQHLHNLRRKDCKGKIKNSLLLNREGGFFYYLYAEQAFVYNKNKHSYIEGVILMYYRPDEDGMTQKEKIEKRENEVLDIIKEYLAKNNYSPSVRDILKKSNLKSTSTVMSYLNRLKGKGIISCNHRTSRSIYIVDQSQKSSVV